MTDENGFPTYTEAERADMVQAAQAGCTAFHTGGKITDNPHAKNAYKTLRGRLVASHTPERRLFVAWNNAFTLCQGNAIRRAKVERMKTLKRNRTQK